MAHLDQHLAETLHGSHNGCGTHALRLLGDDPSALVGELHQFGGHQRQEAVAQVSNNVLGEHAWIAALLHGECQGGESHTGVMGDECFDELVVRQCVGHLATAGSNELERRQRVTRGAPALGKHSLEGIV